MMAPLDLSFQLFHQVWWWNYIYQSPRNWHYGPNMNQAFVQKFTLGYPSRNMSYALFLSPWSWSYAAHDSPPHVWSYEPPTPQGILGGYSFQDYAKHDAIHRKINHFSWSNCTSVRTKVNSTLESEIEIQNDDLTLIENHTHMENTKTQWISKDAHEDTDDGGTK